MKKHLLLALRVLLALAGIGYIAWAVDWVDQVKYPPHTSLPDGTTASETTVYKVVSGRHDPNDPQGQLVVEDATSRSTHTVRSADLKAEEDQPRFVPGILTMLKGADFRLLALALVVLAPIYLILMLRWWLLLRGRGLAVPLWKAFRLTMVGNFFNFCMPGTTGGDLIKAYYAAKRSERRADAVMTVIVDRVAGLLGLVVLAGIAGLFMLSNDTARKVTINIWLGSAVFIVGSVVYFSRRLRAALRVDWLLSKMPMRGLLTKIDQAAVAYRDHTSTLMVVIAMSVLVHLCLATSTAISGFALGIDRPLGFLLTVLPVAILVGAVPISPQGIGLVELVAMNLIYDPPYATANQIVGMLIMFRVNQMFFSVFGAVFLLKGDIHLHPPQADDAPDLQPVPGGADVAAVEDRSV